MGHRIQSSRLTRKYYNDSIAVRGSLADVIQQWIVMDIHGSCWMVEAMAIAAAASATETLFPAAMARRASFRGRGSGKGVKDGGGQIEHNVTFGFVSICLEDIHELSRRALRHPTGRKSGGRGLMICLCYEMAS